MGGTLTTGMAEPAMGEQPVPGMGQLAKKPASKSARVRGGPIPLGRTLSAGLGPDVSATLKLKLAAVLTPERRCLSVCGRAQDAWGGFLIHKRGPLGSDGCIVPVDDEDFHCLMKELEASNGGILTVIEDFRRSVSRRRRESAAERVVAGEPGPARRLPTAVVLRPSGPAVEHWL